MRNRTLNSRKTQAVQGPGPGTGVMQGLEYHRDQAKAGLCPQLRSPDACVYNTSIIQIDLPNMYQVFPVGGGSLAINNYIFIITDREQRRRI